MYRTLASDSPRGFLTCGDTLYAIEHLVLVLRMTAVFVDEPKGHHVDAGSRRVLGPLALGTAASELGAKIGVAMSQIEYVLRQ